METLVRYVVFSKLTDELPGNLYSFCNKNSICILLCLWWGPTVNCLVFFCRISSQLVLQRTSVSWSLTAFKLYKKEIIF